MQNKNLESKTNKLNSNHMDKYMRFIRNLAKGDKLPARARRRLMERELNKLLSDDRERNNDMDGGVS